MKVIGANSVFILPRMAFALASMADAGRFGALFYAVQGRELAAGAVNIALLTLNMRDGLRMAGRLGQSEAWRST